MTNKTLVTLYAEHVGKVSDKWSIYFNEYDRILGAYRNKPVCLLEIGIQNGGSLEIWSKYFPHAQKLVGCDINPDCAGLSYEDPRIAVVVGDANSDTTQAELLRYAPTFDVIMEDGSHRSSDIVKSFARYFPHLADDGVFIAEDLHCSYWDAFEGGLFAPFSAITFFKRLVDVISHEHWGIAKHSTDILRGFFSTYGFAIDEATLQHVHSVEFINSMCVIRKAQRERNRLGARVIVGAVGTVVPGHVLRSSPEELIPDQTGNPWTARDMPPDEEVLLRITELSERDGRIAYLNDALSDRDAKIAILNDAVTARDGQIACLNEALSERDGRIANLKQGLSDRDEQIVILNDAVTVRDAQIASLNQALLAHQNTISWRVTKPVRLLGRQIRRIKRTLMFSAILLSDLKELKRIVIKVVRIYGREGLSGVEKRFRLLQSDQYVREIASYRSLSLQVLGQLNIFAQWWFSNDLRRGFSDRVLSLLRGETKASRILGKSALRFHIDRPQLGLLNIVPGSYDISGWAVDLEAHSAVNVRFVLGHTIHDSDPQQREDVQRAFGPVYELPPRTGFAIALAPPVGVHRLRIDVEAVDGAWIPVRRALLLRIPGINRAQQTESRLSYSAWTRLEQKRLKAEIPDIKRRIDVMVHKPTFTVVVDTRQGGTGLDDTIQSIRRQLYPLWDVRLLSGPAASSLPDDAKTLKDMSLSDIRGDFIVFMHSGQRLARNALYEFAAAINQRPDIDLIYADEDSLAASGSRRDPFHKPGWSPDYLETFNYIGFPACFRAAAARGCFDNVHVYDFVLRFTERTTRVLHVPKILGHGVEKLGVAEAALANAVALDIKALSGRLSRTGRRGSVYEHELHKGCYAVRLDLKRSPLVSVVIPTAGRTVRVGERRIDLIENVIGHIRDRSTYKNIEIIVVDNGDLSRNQLRVLAEAGCRRITYSDPIFNVAKKLNLGVSIAAGELLLLMNDDIEILTPMWIERLLEHFEKPHVGVAGAKLLYPNGQTQHVGVVHNFGNPDHVRRRFPRNDAGYFFSTCGVRNYSAVTGACMMTRASIYREVGGYNAELAVNFNDVDFCMKVRRKGFSVVYTPSAELIHMESLSHPASVDMGELAWYHQRWAAELVSDPFYNERFLTVEPPTFVPCVNQRML
jgi:GT2 family glycosyltransferase